MLHLGKKAIKAMRDNGTFTWRKRRGSIELLAAEVRKYIHSILDIQPALPGPKDSERSRSLPRVPSDRHGRNGHFPGETPTAMEPGTPSGSYSLSGLDNISPYTGKVAVDIPLLKVGGRGEAGYTIILPLQRLWRMETVTRLFRKRTPLLSARSSFLT
jgi:hypothetical protein